MQKALKASGKVLIDLLVKEIVVYNDKIEVYLKYTELPNPDDKHQDFSFYKEEKEILINCTKFNKPPIKWHFLIELFMT